MKRITTIDDYLAAMCTSLGMAGGALIALLLDNAIFVIAFGLCTGLWYGRKAWRA